MKANISSLAEPLRQRRVPPVAEPPGPVADMAATFEQLKREAVQLERQLEEKVSRYQQVRGMERMTVFQGMAMAWP